MNTNTTIQAAPGSARGFYVNRMFSAAAATALTVVWLAAAQPAHAIEMTVSTTAVNYSDLNLATEAGARKLYTRLRYAAARVCGTVDHRNPAWKQCYKSALSGAVSDVGEPTLLAVHRATGADGASSG
jgi:UrcA family protein